MSDMPAIEEGATVEWLPVKNQGLYPFSWLEVGEGFDVVRYPDEPKTKAGNDAGRIRITVSGLNWAKRNGAGVKFTVNKVRDDLFRVTRTQ